LGQLDTVISDSINSTITKYQPGNQIKRSEMGGACGKEGGKHKYTYIYLVRELEGKRQSASRR
jgi:hypothetical protein